MVEKIRARAPCRVDLAGGTLDIWPLGVLHPGARTVSAAVDLEVVAELSPRPRDYVVEQGDERCSAADATALRRQPGGALVGLVAELLELPPLHARLASASPRGGGLGASSALGVALLAAGEALLRREPSPPHRRAAVVRDLEARLMGLPTGTQDHHAALLGGVLEIRHQPGGELVRRLEVPAETLGASLLVAYSGQSHLSARTNWGIVRRRLEGRSESVRLLQGIADVASRVATALEAGDLEGAGRAVGEEWALRRRLAPGISVPAVEEILSRAVTAGAWGGKVCGAGGGGCVAVLAPPRRQEAVARAMEGAGGTLLPCAPRETGIEVERLPA